jgi:DNA-directed RNA polymerase specialized sigma24 family protein
MTDELAEPILEHLVAAWRSLPVRQQKVLWHFAVLGEPEDDVAHRLGEPVAAVPALLERARLELGVRYREVVHLAAVAADLAPVER